MEVTENAKLPDAQEKSAGGLCRLIIDTGWEGWWRLPLHISPVNFFGLTS